MPKKKKIISYTRVSADIFHYGHLKLFEKAKAVSDYHICGLYGDELCIKWNGSLVMKYNEREAIISKIDFVDKIMEQNHIDPTENLNLIHKNFPDCKIILFQGHQEWIGLPGTDFIRSIGGEIIRSDYYPSLSRNKIKDKLQNTAGNNNYDIDNYILGDISYFPFLNSTKADTLASLKKQKLKYSSIENLFVFTTLQWKGKTENILDTIKEIFDDDIIIRSSSKVEDSLFSSYAGYFHSELNIDSDDKKDVRNAIELVIKSYSKHDKTSDNDQILVQSQTKDILYSGVVFTREFQKNSPYYLINYDKSKNTDSVTSGKIGNKIEIIKNITSKDLPSPWKQLITSIREIEGYLHNLALDIEFGIKKKNKIVIFQVRPIAANQKYYNNIDEKIFTAVQSIIEKYKRLSKTAILRNSYTLSDMSFWNPAEIIGDRSNTLAYSTYRFLILHRVWNTGLLPLGYKKVERDLIVKFANKSYIEVETAFTSLLPKKLNKSITKKLVCYYTNKLKNNPELHDKIEFEIVHNCYTPVTEDQLLELKPILNNEEYNQFKQSLKQLTQNIFQKYNDIKLGDIDSIKELEKRRKFLIQESLNAELIDKIIIAVDLLNDAKELGTPQFSRMARLAFIGNQYLKGLVLKNVISERDCEIFLTNIDTVASEIKKDFNKVVTNKLSIDEFNNLYGHLRPGTYDIKKIPYGKDASYFVKDNKVQDMGIMDHNPKAGDLKKFQRNIENYLIGYDLDITVDELLCFIEETIKYREKFKFEFTKNLSFAYELLVEAGSELGFDRKLLSHLSIENMQSVNSENSEEDILDYWSAQIDGIKANENVYDHIAMPSLVYDQKDFHLVQSYFTRPNYITTSVIKADLIDLEKLVLKNFDEVSGKIVLLENADPGYDWIFAKNIKGLITRFGGVASHMAIRCAEFGIPAAIGCGEVIYKDMKDMQIVELDCKNKLITGIR